ncbi:MAG: copper chaperone Copz family protein [Gammaproteobacteria bacterium]|nr:copper chaperone Copz family protein [Gammaproteobacteria bacterium]
MSDCCSTESDTSCATTSPKKRPCPTCGAKAVEVKLATLLHHLKQPWEAQLGDQKYYFCPDVDCRTVYFGEDETVMGIDEIRTAVGQKRTDPERLLCYCFGVSQSQAELDPDIKRFVTQQTKLGSCACDSRNPSGRCCLKDFPK